MNTLAPGTSLSNRNVAVVAGGAGAAEAGGAGRSAGVFAGDVSGTGGAGVTAAAVMVAGDAAPPLGAPGWGELPGSSFMSSTRPAASATDTTRRTARIRRVKDR